MSYYGGIYGSYGGYGAQPRRDHEFYEKAWKRKNLPEWDAKWHTLSHAARIAFMNDVKGPVKSQARAPQPSVSVDKFRPQVLKELAEAGFVKIEPGKKAKDPDRVFAVDALYDFTFRVRGLFRYHLLAKGQPDMLSTYMNYCYYNSETFSALGSVLRKAGIEDYFSTEDFALRYVRNYRWPNWVAAEQKDALAEKILKVVQEAGKPVLLAELAEKIPGSDPQKVRASVDKLVGYMALFEDLEGGSLDIAVGLLPTVREALEQASKPRKRPPLEVCEQPQAVGPEASVVVNDLRAYLLEITSEPPRLRQDRLMFQKEVERFLDILEPLPEFFTTALKWSPETRINQAHDWALTLGLVKEKVEGKEIRLHVAPKGASWLTGTLAEQYAEVYQFLRAPAKSNEQYIAHRSFLFTSTSDHDPYSSYGVGDSRFLGVNAVAMTTKKGSPTQYHWNMKAEDYQALRDALFHELDVLPVGVFHRLESVLAHCTFGRHNPLHLGQDITAVSVFWGGRSVPALEELRDEKARLLLETLIDKRLVPLGVFRLAADAEGKLCVARTPQLDAYFGRKGAKFDLGGAGDGESRVVVQPDFSVIIIGLNPAPAAELAPFCERTTKNVGSGAVVFKLTRDSVIKAVSHGLKSAEILNRLQRHSSNDLPANVLREVQGWCDWVRHVTPTVVTVLRCEDRGAADRAAAALGKQAERLGDTMVALPQGRLTPAERAKLQAQGIIVLAGDTDTTAAPRKAKKKAKRRASYYYD